MSATDVSVTVVEHPVVADALARIRDATTPNALFRQNLERIGSLLLVRATEDLPTVDTTVSTPLTTAPARRLAVQPVVVPILRAGLGFVHAAQELLPDADVGFVGISRDEETFTPKPYVNKLPESLAGRPVIVIDPMLATGGSLVHTVELLLERGAPQPITAVCALCAPEGIDHLRTVDRERLRGIERILHDVLSKGEIRRDLVMANVPPAWVHHVRLKA